MTRFVALDIETANADLASICQIGMVAFDAGRIQAEKSFLVDPETWFDPVNISIHGISEQDVEGERTFQELMPELNEWIEDQIVVHHTYFDRTAIQRNCARYGLPSPSCTWLDTTRVARKTWEAVSQRGYGLKNLASMLGITFQHHDALEDARTTGQILAAALGESQKGLDEWIDLLAKPWKGSSPFKSMDGNPEGPLFGEVVLFTGALSIPRPDAAKHAAELGCDVKTSISKKVTTLVVGDQDVTKLVGHDRSIKHRNAIELQQSGHPIRIIRESDFLAMMELE